MGLLIFVTAFRFAGSEPHVVERAVPEPTLAFDFVVEKPPTEQSIDLPLELRDNSAPGDWSRTEDYELAATRGALTFTCNNHFIVRNMSEAQLVASYTIEY